MKRSKKVASILAAGSILTTLMAPALAAGLTDVNMNGWAERELERADRLELVTGRLGTDYTRAITRLEFAGLAVNCAEVFRGAPVDTGGTVFRDTADPVAGKAASAGIVKGTGDGSTFSPDRPITREEIAAMLDWTIGYMDAERIPAAGTLEEYKDRAALSSWAKPAMERMTGGGIMAGTDRGTLAPQENTSIEQAVALIFRTYRYMLQPDMTELAASFLKEEEMGRMAALQKSYTDDASGFTDAKADALTLAEVYEKDGHLAASFLKEEEMGRMAALQKSYTDDASGFTDAKADALTLAEVYEKDGHTYLLYELRYRLKADRPDALVVFDEKVEDGWLLPAVPTVFVVEQKDGNAFSWLGGYQTEFTPDGYAEGYRMDFEAFLKEH